MFTSLAPHLAVAAVHAGTLPQVITRIITKQVEDGFHDNVSIILKLAISLSEVLRH